MKEKTKSFLKRLASEESAQGATEYILLVVVVIALVAVFKDRIVGVINSKVGELGGQISGFSGN